MKSSYLQHKDIIITANNRQVLALEKFYWQQQNKHNKKIQLPLIQDYKSFLSHQWQGLLSERILLSQTQQFFIWKKIITNVSLYKKKSLTTLLKHFNLIKLDNQLIKTVQAEYALVRKFNITLTDLDEYFCLQGQLLTQWITQYKQYLQQHNLIDEFDVPALLATKSFTGSLYYYGFKVLTPEQKNLFQQHLAQKLTLNIPFLEPNNKVLSFIGIEDEIQAMVAWVTQQRFKHPKHKIGVVVPELKQYKHQITLALDKALGHHKQLTYAVDKNYNVSLGKSLLDYDLVNSAMNLLAISLQYGYGVLEHTLLKKVLLTDSISTSTKQLKQKYGVITELKKLQKNTISPQELKQILSQNHCSHLLSIFDELYNYFIQLKQGIHHKQTHSQWMLVFMSLLKIWGFAQHKHLSSDGYQLLNKYQNSQLIFNQLDILNEVIDAKKAYANWQQLLRMTIFSPKLSKQVNISVLGQLEAQGLFFDQVWIMGMSTDFLPGRIKKHRFINQNLAKQYQLPASCYEQLTKYSDASLTYLNNLSTIQPPIFSYAQFNAQGQSQTHCAFLTAIEPVALKSDVVHISKFFEQILDDKAPALVDKKIKQGVKTLGYQSQCAFRGFVQRLNIEESSPNEIGIDAMTKGFLIHQTLEGFYRLITNKKSLLANQEKLPEIIQAQIKLLLPKPTIFEQLESKRIHNIVLNFLTLELLRDDFEIIALEAQQNVNISGLRFAIRLDRLDKDCYGNHIIFDYKTSNVSLSVLGKTQLGLNGIISQAQLPIYAINNSTDGIAFISLTSRENKYLGFANSEVLSQFLNKKNANTEKFNQLKEFWQTQLNQISIDFQHGKADVLPSKNACKYCTLSNLCRVEGMKL